MRDYYGKPILCPLDCIIRIIQLRAWEDHGESLNYEDLQLYLITGKPGALTEAQMEFASELRGEIRAAANAPINGYGRRRSFCAAGLVTGSADYRRVFYPRSFDERFGGFGNRRTERLKTPKWMADRKNWQRSVEPSLQDLRGTKEKAG